MHKVKCLKQFCPQAKLNVGATIKHSPLFGDGMLLAVIPHMDCSAAAGGFSGLLTELVLSLSRQGLEQGMFVGQDWVTVV